MMRSVVHKIVIDRSVFLNTGDRVSIILLYIGGQLDLQRCKPSISPSNIAQNANPGTALKTARPVDSKTPPKCSN